MIRSPRRQKKKEKKGTFPGNSHAPDHGNMGGGGRMSVKQNASLLTRFWVIE